ncbi:hypothetical protein [Azospirillum sp. TSO22-1]|uniref:hypothetical protein n=1 Tax=Azospirillum sp. TSO22-1 TaxID=716789 RepID=UPI000D61C7B7|nr:hypothetical protein [Azospirillum sp. TSO22-1]PWC45765.1 hypothetical protein TSO221_15865 [Azospirillum sp. TSO22-1]
MLKITAAVLAVLAAAIPGSAFGLTYGNATCGQLVDEVVNTKKLFDKLAADISRQGEQPATRQEIVQLSLLTQRHDRAFAMLAIKCPETLSNIDFN